MMNNAILSWNPVCMSWVLRATFTNITVHCSPLIITINDIWIFSWSPIHYSHPLLMWCDWFHHRGTRHQQYYSQIKDNRFVPKVCQISPKWDKEETFSYQISVNFDSKSPNVLKFDLRESSIPPIWGQSDTPEGHYSETSI